MGKKLMFSSGRSGANYYNWFKGNENWNPSKVKTYTKEEYGKIKQQEELERQKKKSSK